MKADMLTRAPARCFFTSFACAFTTRHALMLLSPNIHHRQRRFAPDTFFGRRWLR